MSQIFLLSQLHCKISRDENVHDEEEAAETRDHPQLPVHPFIDEWPFVCNNCMILILRISLNPV
jgi:hypothetical protein